MCAHVSVCESTLSTSYVLRSENSLKHPCFIPCLRRVWSLLVFVSVLCTLGQLTGVFTGHSPVPDLTIRCWDYRHNTALSLM